jgi:hypothetical protein
MRSRFNTRCTSLREISGLFHISVPVRKLIIQHYALQGIYFDKINFLRGNGTVILLALCCPRVLIVKETA